MIIPPNLKRLYKDKSGAAWLATLPNLIDQLVKEWQLELGDPYSDSNVSCVIPAHRDGNAVVLKIQWPHPECAYEAEALSAWDGEGAVRLLGRDVDRHALLLERCMPGHHLSVCRDVDPLNVMINLLPRLWKQAGLPFKTLADEASTWASNIHGDWEASGRSCERMLVDVAVDYLSELSKTQPEQVLVHQDLHGDNVLSAEREPWLVIDPKPLIGERAFALAPIIRSFEFGHSRKAVVNRLHRLSAELGLDRERVRGWAIAQTMAWSFESDYVDHHHETARWLMED